MPTPPRQRVAGEEVVLGGGVMSGGAGQGVTRDGILHDLLLYRVEFAGYRCKAATVRRARALKRKDGRLNIISQRLKAARKQHDPPLTMEALAQRIEELEGIGITLGMITKIEAGLRGVYDYEVAAFARVLEVDANWLLGLKD
jgi:hypothetical protein